MDDLEKMRRAKTLDLARRQEEADRARMIREGVPMQDATLETDYNPQNPNVRNANDN